MVLVCTGYRGVGVWCVGVWVCVGVGWECVVCGVCGGGVGSVWCVWGWEGVCGVWCVWGWVGVCGVCEGGWVWECVCVVCVCVWVCGECVVCVWGVGCGWVWCVHVCLVKCMNVSGQYSSRYIDCPVDLDSVKEGSLMHSVSLASQS